MLKMTLAVLLSIPFSGQPQDQKKPEPPPQPIDLTKPGMPPGTQDLEIRLLCELKLTPEQRAKWAAMETQCQKKDQEFRDEYVRTGSIDKLFENRDAQMKWLRDQKKSILTPDQYRQYKAAWDKALEPQFENGRKLSDRVIRLTNRDGTPSKYLLKPLTGPIKE